jgi:hypothetical protein
MRRRYQWLIVAALALPAGCGDRDSSVPTTVDAQSQTFSHTQTFTFTGKPQRFEVPHVKWLQVDVYGAGGAGTSNQTSRGARVRALIPASLSKELVIYVGGSGDGVAAGFNGGQAGGEPRYCSSCDGYGGGGASDVRLGLATIGDRVIVAAGGGGLGGKSGGTGGDGGGEVGGSGGNGPGSGSYTCGGYGGSGGTQTSGGVGGKGGTCGYRAASGADGTVGIGGAGGASYYTGAGGGGGGGFYGGGGGGAGSDDSTTYRNGVGGGGGGAGGSSFVGKRAKDPHVWQGWKTAVGNGLVVIDW